MSSETMIFIGVAFLCALPVAAWLGAMAWRDRTVGACPYCRAEVDKRAAVCPSCRNALTPSR